MGETTAIPREHNRVVKNAKRKCRTVPEQQRDWVRKELNLMAQYTEESEWLKKGKYHEWIQKTDWEKMIPYQLDRYLTSMEPTHMDSVVIDGYLRLLAFEENKRRQRGEYSLILSIPHQQVAKLVSEDYEDDYRTDLQDWLEEALAEYTGSLTDVKMILIPILMRRTYWTLALCDCANFTIRVFTSAVDTAADWSIATVSPPIIHIINFLTNSTV